MNPRDLANIIVDYVLPPGNPARGVANIAAAGSALYGTGKSMGKGTYGMAKSALNWGMTQMAKAPSTGKKKPGNPYRKVQRPQKKKTSPVQIERASVLYTKNKRWKRHTHGPMIVIRARR